MTGGGRLSGQVGFVTGGGRGIGQAIVTALAAEGMRVAALARSAEQLEETAAAVAEQGGEVRPVVGDVSRAEDVEAAVARTEDELGPVDLLVSNAARTATVGPLWEIDVESWWQELEVKLRGTLLCTRAVLPGMVSRGQGRVIDVIGGGAKVPLPYNTGYACSNVAISRMVETAAVELRGSGVAIFAMGPGPVRTTLSEANLTNPEALRWRGDMRAALADQWRPPEDAAALAVRLAAGEADVLSGRMVSVRDDLDDMLAHAEEITADELYVLRMGALASSGAEPRVDRSGETAKR